VPPARANLAADFPAGAQGRVDVRVAEALPDERDDLVEVAGADLLPRVASPYRDDIRRVSTPLTDPSCGQVGVVAMGDTEVPSHSQSAMPPFTPA
jgi:hypothetical protein